MNNFYYPPDLIRLIILNWEVYRIRLAYNSEPEKRIYVPYIFYCPAVGPFAFIHHLN
jgi:hypothetical protein